MVKVMWLLKRADHLSLAEFRTWWLDHHVRDIAADQAPYLKMYRVDIRIDDETPFAGKPAGECPWDGIAEQYFETIADYNAVYARSERATRADTLAHCSAFERLVVEEHDIALG
jgi:EthD domain